MHTRRIGLRIFANSAWLGGVNYVLGYPKPPSRKNRYRKLEITCSKPGVVVRHHGGYTPFPQK